MPGGPWSSPGRCWHGHGADPAHRNPIPIPGPVAPLSPHYPVRSLQPGGAHHPPQQDPSARKAAAALSLPVLSSSSSTALQAPTHSYAALCTTQSTPDSAVPTALVEEGSSAAPAPTPLPVSPAPCPETPVSGSRAPSVEQLLGEGLRPQCPPSLTAARPVLRSYRQLFSFCAEA
ncbi:uncharacterized protein LOC125689825 [Lagopus muta]|uniref:uncharacterized protein LOC125689825 n=1 Tax=Lagopus muta TaxID=64668 RepID=UPI00209D4FC4|nr:uncharacterized protein LOC125689825 [Lagopus muta]